jgi:hypothetical protein
MFKDTSLNRVQAVERLTPLIGRSFLFNHFLHGFLAFVVFELCLSSLFRALDLSRSRGFILGEFLLFSSVSGLTYAYALLSEQNARAQRALSHGLSRLQEHSELRNSYQGLIRRLRNVSAGIQESLSAIMFFTRAHLVGAENTQKARDLREIAERIDQVQLLLKEMQSSVNGELETAEMGSPSLELPDPAQAQGLSKPDQEEVRNWVKPASSLRKSARKVLILPVVVRFVQADNSLEFQTFTVNVCEEGACIILSSSLLAQEEVIEVQVPPEFAARAKLKWIQPVGTNSFRLGGIEFLDSKFSTSPS